MKKQMILLGMIGMILLGCGNEKHTQMEEENSVITVKEVLEEIDEIKVNGGSFTAEASNKYRKLEGNSLRNMQMKGNIEYAWEGNPVDNIYMNQDFEVIQNGTSNEKVIDTQLEMHCVNRGEEKVAYIKNSQGTWNCVEAEVTDTIDEDIYVDDFILEYSCLTEEQANIVCVDETNVYRFEIKATYEQAGVMLKKIMEMMLSKIDGISMNTEWNFTFEVDKETYMPISCQIRLNETFDGIQEDKTVWSEKCKIDIMYTYINTD